MMNSANLNLLNTQLRNNFYVYIRLRLFSIPISLIRHPLFYHLHVIALQFIYINNVSIF